MIKKLRRNFVLINMSIVTVLLTIMLWMVFQFNAQALEIQSLEQMRHLAQEIADHREPDWQNIEAPMVFFVLEQDSTGTLRAWGSEYYDLTDEGYLRELLDAALTAGEESGVLKAYALRFQKILSPQAVRCLFADISGEQLILKNLLSICVTVGVLTFLAFSLVSILLSRTAVRHVERAWEQQRQFVADASHELKTPLAVIMANAELLESGEFDSTSGRRFAGDILSMSYQMRSLVERMLEMARVDSVKIPLEPVDLSQLTEDATLSVQLLFEEKNRPLVWDIPEAVFIRGSESHLFQLLDVLLDNALKYSEGEGPVEVALKGQGHSCSLSVTSPGTPLTQQEKRDIFKRFYRGNQARTIDGSYGLGLSIAQGIVTAHRGKIRVVTGNATNTFLVQFPTFQPPENR